MKKNLLIIFACACVTMSKANPLPTPPPMIGISEFGLDSNGNWVIELWYNNISNENTHMPVDSIFISTSTGRSKLENFRFENSSGIMIVRNDSLLSNLNINSVGDSIQLEYYYYHFIETVKVLAKPAIFGNFKNATLNAPKTGESIASYFVFSDYTRYNYGPYYENIFSIDKSSNLGIQNDSTGMCGTLKGKIYDINNQVLTNFTLSFYTKGIFGITPSADGSYSVRVFSYKNRITQIFYNEGSNRFTVDITPLELDVKPDTIIIADIHIQKITAIKEIKSDPVTTLQISPNPIKDLSFSYEISIPVKSSTSFIELINLNGQKIAQFPIAENKGKINLPANAINGMYTLQLFVNNKNYGTSKILIAR